MDSYTLVTLNLSIFDKVDTIQPKKSIRTEDRGEEEAMRLIKTIADVRVVDDDHIVLDLGRGSSHQYKIFFDVATKSLCR